MFNPYPFACAQGLTDEACAWLTLLGSSASTEEAVERWNCANARFQQAEAMLTACGVEHVGDFQQGGRDQMIPVYRQVIVDKQAADAACALGQALRPLREAAGASVARLTALAPECIQSCQAVLEPYQERVEAEEEMASESSFHL